MSLTSGLSLQTQPPIFSTPHPATSPISPSKKNTITISISSPSPLITSGQGQPLAGRVQAIPAAMHKVPGPAPAPRSSDSHGCIGITASVCLLITVIVAIMILVPMASRR